MRILEKMLTDVKTVAILGHIHPDGDCAGSCLGLYNYLAVRYPELEVRVYLEELPPKFHYLKGYDQIVHHASDGRTYDLCVCLDSGDKDRFGEFAVYLETAGRTLCIDHHITNTSYAQENLVEPFSSSTCEVLYDQLDEAYIDKAAAECLYTGLIHDTGVFKYSGTTAKTMMIAGKLMDKGIDFGSIIDDSFYKKTYVQNQILGRALLESITFLDGRCIFSVVRQKDMDFYGVGSQDMDGIIDQLRMTEGVECAIFIYETGTQEYKVSLRSKKVVDVSKIAAYFGGGGHRRAAGCTMGGSIHDVVNNLSVHIAKQLEE